MFTVAILGDLCTHGAKIIEGSSKRSIGGMPVARLGDRVLCPQHGKNKIISITGGMPFTEGLLTACTTAKTACGAILLVSAQSTVFQDVTGAVQADTFAMEMEDMSSEEKQSYLAGKFGSAGAASSYLRSQGGGGGSAEPVTDFVDPNATSKLLGCDGIKNNTPDSFVVSGKFTVGALSNQIYQPPNCHTIPERTALGMSRADVICNLKHLATNSLDRCVDFLSAKGYGVRLGSGFRNNTNGSDHNRGSAADMHLFKSGVRVTDFSAIVSLSKQMIQAGVPFTQVGAETQNGRPWIHWANRKSGGKSNPPFFTKSL
jgi:uncharacterized Zn-binding protein involved in type VI secretion